ncbi:MAG: hypothetical protein ACREP7_03620 [Lysobacter sp.]
MPFLSGGAIAVEIVGAVIGYFYLSTPDLFTRAWLGAVFGAIPGYALGLLLQWKLQPERLATHAVMVRRQLLIAVLGGLAGVWLWQHDFGY